MHTKDDGDRRGGSRSARLGAVVLSAALAWMLTGPSDAEAARCGIEIIGTCADPQEPPAPTTTTTTTTAPAPPPPAPEPSSSEAAARLLSLLNDERAGAGLPPFTLRGDVTEIAAGWSGAMARAEHLSHNDAYFTKDTRTRLRARMLGENVARNPSVDGAHRALMASPPHRANILDGRFLVIGIGAELRNGSWWVTEDFVQPETAGATPGGGAAAVSSTPPLAAPTTPPTSPAPKPAASQASIRPAAETDHGEVLAATATAPAPSLVDLTPSRASNARRGLAPTNRSSSTSRIPAAAGAAGVLALAFALVYRASCASASASIRCS